MKVDRAFIEKLREVEKWFYANKEANESYENCVTRLNSSRANALALCLERLNAWTCPRCHAVHPDSTARRDFMVSIDVEGHITRHEVACCTKCRSETFHDIIDYLNAPAARGEGNTE